MEELGPVFYNVVMPAMLTFGFGYWMYLLQRRGGATTVDEFQVLFAEVQEERAELKSQVDRLEEKVQEYRNQLYSVMDDEMAKYRKLEDRLKQVEREKERLESENQSLKALVNGLTSKLVAAQEQLEIAQGRISALEKNMAKTSNDVRGIKKQTGELKFPRGDGKDAEAG